MPGLFDSHAHLDSEEYGDELEAVVARARAAGVEGIVVVGLWRQGGEFGSALELARREPRYFSAALGIHPHDCARVPEGDWGELGRRVREAEVVAVGETGLDFHYDHSPRSVQEASFRRSLALAREVEKPVVIHVREADEACVRVLAEEGVPRAGGLIHCFTGDARRVRAYLELGLTISVAGVVTFKGAHELREAVKEIPRDRLLIETDCPFLAPVPHRGRRNEPAYIERTAEKVAELWGSSMEEVASRTARNARRFFGLERTRE
ncbi:MAG TPA: TatD family hydrolase [Anaeromyxobacteraceae bacterium]|nr:TatD family hydrolase [Anaeromyxobacteraceae bacterium]